MAKKNNDAAYEQFLADLKAINPAVEELIKDDKVSAKLKESVLARSDYSSAMDALRTERETFATEVAEARQKIEGWQKWYGQTSQEVASVQKKLKAYEDAYGEIEAGDTKNVAKRIGVSKEELSEVLEARTREHDLAAIKFADDLTDIKIDFKDRFKDKLDTEAVFKLAGERQVDLRTAYDIHIADRVEKARSEEVEARIKREREEAVSEYAAKHNLPVVPSTSAVGTHVLDAKEVATTPQGRVAAALQGYMQAKR